MSIFRVNTNSSALRVQRRLDRGTRILSEAQERLSSGQRINSASDDAAGLAISQKTTSQILGLQQAAKNAQDSVSMIQTAEGALEETHSSLQRMRKLAVQAANDTLTSRDRENIQREVSQLAREIQRISDQTQFNTKNLLNGDIEKDGPLGEQQFQVGANESQTIDFTISYMGTSREGLSISGDGTLKGEDIDQPLMVMTSPDSNAFNSSAVETEIVKKSDGSQALALASAADLNGNGNPTAEGTIIAEQKNTNPRKFSTKSVGGLAGDGAFELNVRVQEGARFTHQDLNDSDSNFRTSSITTIEADAQDVNILNPNHLPEATNYSLRVSDRDQTLPNAKLQLVKNGGVVADQSMDNLTNGLTNKDGEVVAEFNNDEIAIDTAGTLDGSGTSQVKEEFAFTKEGGAEFAFKGPDVTSTGAAERTISTLDDGIETVSSVRSNLGALQNRLNTVIDVDKITSENLKSARSRIRDSDVAQESARQTRGNILTQAGTSILAQANQNPELALQLIGR